MKKSVCILLSMLMVFALALPVFAAQPEITQQLRSQSFREGDLAEYTLRAQGEYLKCKWYLEFEGKTYCLNDWDGNQPWENYAGNYYGARQEGNAFTYYFNGIGLELDGSVIWAELEDGHYLLETNRIIIQVEEKTAPQVNVSESFVVVQDSILDLYCQATDPSGGTLSYEWYRCSTGLIQDIRAVMHNTDTYRCDTSQVGVSYYTCLVSSSSGMERYSSMIRVEVIPEESDEGIPVLFTDGSKPQAGQSMTVDIQAMADYDAAIYNAWLENSVTYIWYVDGTAISQLINKDSASFTDADVGSKYQVMVKCQDLEIYSEEFEIQAKESASEFFIKTETLPDAKVGEEYYTRLESTDLDAEFWEYYNPGKDNDLAKTGLTLQSNGVLEGIPTQAGSFTFTVAAAGKGGEDYQELTLVIQPGDTEPPTEAPTDVPTDPPVDTPTEAPGDTPTDAPVAPEPPADDPTQPAPPTEDPDPIQPHQPGEDGNDGGMPWWGIALIALGSAGVGVAVALILIRKKK